MFPQLESQLLVSAFATNPRKPGQSDESRVVFLVNPWNPWAPAVDSEVLPGIALGH